jgi:phospholipid-binding lipoprotein MlaA
MDQGDDQGDIVVTGRVRSPTDPLEKANAKSYEVTQSVDKAFVGPVAIAYKKKLPGPIRSGLRNFLYNVREPNVFLNFLLQLKPGKAMETLGRFAINTTIGGAGLFDVAKRRPFKLPRRPNGFADSLGYYGVKPGPYLFLPLIGPTTVRDLVGGGLDRLVLPLSVGKPFNELVYTVPIGVLSTVDHRAEFDEQLHKLHDGTADPYEASRAFYLQRRQAEIDHLRDRDRGAGSPESELANPAIDPVTPPARGKFISSARLGRPQEAASNDINR